MLSAPLIMLYSIRCIAISSHFLSYSAFALCLPLRSAFCFPSLLPSTSLRFASPGYSCCTVNGKVDLIAFFIVVHSVWQLEVGHDVVVPVDKGSLFSRSLLSIEVPWMRSGSVDGERSKDMACKKERYRTFRQLKKLSRSFLSLTWLLGCQQLALRVHVGELLVVGCAHDALACAANLFLHLFGVIRRLGQGCGQSQSLFLLNSHLSLPHQVEWPSWQSCPPRLPKSLQSHSWLLSKHYRRTRKPCYRQRPHSRQRRPCRNR